MRLSSSRLLEAEGEVGQAGDTICVENAREITGLGSTTLTLSTKGSNAGGALEPGTWTLTVPQDALATSLCSKGPPGCPRLPREANSLIFPWFFKGFTPNTLILLCTN